MSLLTMRISRRLLAAGLGLVAAVALSGCFPASPPAPTPGPTPPPEPITYAKSAAAQPLATTPWTSAIDLPRQPTFGAPISLNPPASLAKPSTTDIADSIVTSDCGILLAFRTTNDDFTSLVGFDPAKGTIVFTVGPPKNVSSRAWPGVTTDGCVAVLQMGNGYPTTTAIALDLHTGAVLGSTSNAALDDCEVFGSTVVCTYKSGSPTTLRAWRTKDFGRTPLWSATSTLSAQPWLDGLVGVGGHFVDPTTGATLAADDSRSASMTQFGTAYTEAVLPDGTPSGQVLKLTNIAYQNCNIGLFGGSCTDIDNDTCQLTLWNLRQQLPVWTTSVPLRPCAHTTDTDSPDLTVPVVAGNTLIVNVNGTTWGIDLASGQVLWQRPGSFGAFPSWTCEACTDHPMAGVTAEYLTFGPTGPTSWDSFSQPTSIVDVRTGKDVSKLPALVSHTASPGTPGDNSPFLPPWTLSPTQLQLLANGTYTAYRLPAATGLDAKPLWTVPLSVAAEGFWTFAIKGRMYVVSVTAGQTHVIPVNP